MKRRAVQPGLCDRSEKAVKRRRPLLSAVPAIVCLLLPTAVSAQIYSTHKIFAPGMSISQVNPSVPNNPSGEDVTKAIDGSVNTKYLNFTKLNTGFTVNTNANSIVRTISITTANDFPERDPVNFTLEGSNNGNSWTSITSGTLVCNTTRYATQSFGFANTASYSWYRVVFPSVCNTSTASCMQVSEVQLYQADGAYNKTSGLSYAKIQDAINAANGGDTIRVDAGTYIENLMVNKSLAILGPNDNVSPCTGTRSSEATVVPANPGEVETGEIFHVGASNVTIKGFTIDGNNPALTSNVTNTIGVDMDAAEGVTIYVDNINNLVVSNNIFRNLSYTGVTIFGASYSAPPTTGHMISSNLMENLGTYNDPSNDPNYNINRYGLGVLLYNSQYANISGNCMNNVRTGVQTGNFHLANAGTATYQLIANNTMTNVRRSGIFHNLHNSLASGYTLSGNSITGTSNANETKWDGVELFSLNTPCTATNNTINATSVTQTSYGYDVWNVASANPSAISNGTVTGTSIGVFVNNYDGYGSNATDGANATLSGINITPNASGTGIRVYDNPFSTHANVQLSLGSGVQLNNGTDGLVVENASASVAALSNVAFSGQSGSHIKLVNNTNNLNATTASFGGVTGGTATLAQLFAIEDKIVHKIDNSVLGFVLVKANNDFVTANGGSIQNGVDAASTGFNVNVNSGTYAENVTVGKSVNILGPNASVNPCSGTRSAEAIVVPATSAIASGEIFHVAANVSNVTISGFTIDGDNTNLTSGYTGTNGADMDAAEGVTVYEDGVSNLTVSNNIFQNLSYFGVTLYGGSTATATSGHSITNNKMQNLGTYAAASGISGYGGGVLLYDNQYAAITNNCMSNVRIGVQTGNFNQANPGTAASQVISGNTMSVRRRGIFHNLAYGAASPYTLSGNSITGVANANETAFWDGMLIASMQATASTASNNTVNGAAVTAIPTIGYSVWNCQVAPLISGGTVSGVSLGINVNNYESYPSTGSNANNTSATIDGVTITGATTAGIRVNDNPLNSNNATVAAEIKNVNVSGSPAGILVSGSDASANVHDNVTSIVTNTVGVDVAGGIATLYRNQISTNGTGARFANGGRLASASQNFITNNTGNGITVASNAGTIGAINSNDLSGNTGFAISNASAATLSATCNWFGSTAAATVATKVSGPVTYVPYLSSGVDADNNAATGFQPNVGCTSSCPAITATSAVTPLYPMAGQKMQTIFLNFPKSAQTETINVSVSGGTMPYTYNYTMSGCNTTTANGAFVNPGTSSYTFAPTAANICNGNNDNIYTFNITVNDAQGCGATTMKRLNVVNPYVGDSVRICHKTQTRTGTSQQLITTTYNDAVNNHLPHNDALGNCNAFTGRMANGVEGSEEAPVQALTEMDIHVYPNPSTGIVTVELPDGVKEGAYILITDVQGKVVAQRQLAKDGVSKASFELGSLAKGMYLITVKDGDMMQHTKIVLQ